jgi:hypothetical protein
MICFGILNVIATIRDGYLWRMRKRGRERRKRKKREGKVVHCFLFPFTP